MTAKNLLAGNFHHLVQFRLRCRQFHNLPHGFIAYFGFFFRNHWAASLFRDLHLCDRSEFLFRQAVCCNFLDFLQLIQICIDLGSCIGIL